MCLGEICLCVCVCNLRKKGVFCVPFVSKRLVRGWDRSALLPNTPSYLPSDPTAAVRLRVQCPSYSSRILICFVRRICQFLPRCPQLEASTHTDTHTHSSSCIVPPGVPVAPTLPYRGFDKETMIYLLGIPINLLVQGRPSRLSPVCMSVCVCVFVYVLRIRAAWSDHTHLLLACGCVSVFQLEYVCCVRLSDIRLDAGHAAVEPGPVAARAGGSRRCHIAHWLRGSRWHHVSHHRGLLLRVEHLLVDMAAMLVDVMAAMVTKGKRHRHSLLIELVGRTSLWHACDSLGGRISLCCAGG